MTEKPEAEFTNLRYGDRSCPHGRVVMDREADTITFISEKKGLINRLLRRRVTPIREKITATTTIKADYPRVTIGGAAFELADQESLQSIVDAATRPRREEKQRIERLILDAEKTAERFLVERGKALTNIHDLIIEPRKTLMMAEEQIIDAAEPIEAYRKQASEGFEDVYSEVTSKINALRSHVKEDDIQRICAVIYGVGRAQDALFTGDEELLSKSLTLIERATARSLRPEQLRNLPITTLTTELCTELNTITLNIIDAA